ncbi:hypothetical protein FRC17_007864 [Serendipita sp. 399]|nr:hypothetical protein FRC17_007864 [Serendipita sp. 399]
MLKAKQVVCTLRRGRTITSFLPSSQFRLISSSVQRRVEQPYAFAPPKPQLEPPFNESPLPDPQIGDYPRLPAISNQLEPPTGWDDVQYRRNFGQTLHEQEEALNMFSPDLPHANIEPRTAVFQASVAFAILGGIIVLLGYNAPQLPATRRTYPRDGLVDELGGWQQNKANPESLEER